MADRVRQDLHATRTMEPGPPATGRRQHSDGIDWVVHTRTIALPVAEAWALLASPEQLARWIGTWRRGDAGANGEFTFGHEGEDVLPLSFRLERLEPPRLVALALRDPGEVDAWRLEVTLDEDGPDGDRTGLTVRQSILDPALAPAAAAGCEFYLDRLVTLLEGGDLEALDFDAYFIRQASHYRRLFPVQRSGLGS